MTRLLAPARHGELLEVPPLGELPALAQRARQRLSSGSWGAARTEARREVLALTGAQASTDAVWLVSGHQPELYHPGVWAKSFAIANLARRVGGVALSLIVDSDLVKSTALRAPVRGREGWPALEMVPFDRWTGEAPWEERHVADEGLFASFGQRVAEVMRPWGVEPLAEALWTEVLRHQGPIGARFAAARQALERRWGCGVVEAPVSALCGTRAFADFVARILDDLPRFVAVHNRALAQVRQARGIRGTSHPVPDLAAEDGQIELPLWQWRAGDSRRQRVFASRRGAKYHLALDAADGVKLRTRALATTLFTRLYLADLFLHGIGGGLYDEVTDVVIHEFFGIEPPPYAVLSATYHLPLPRYPSTYDDVRRLQAEARRLWWSPQRFLPGHPVEAERRAILASPPDTRRARRLWFARQRAMLEVMRREMEPRYHEVVTQMEAARREASANALLLRRDYSFVLFPEAELRPLASLGAEENLVR